jgi:hypothetical protein
MSFSSDLAKFSAKTNSKLDRVVKKIVIDMGTRIVLRTPVGEPSTWQSPAPQGYVGGRARANWQYGNGEMPQSVLDFVDKGGNSTVNKIIGGVQASKAASIHWVANNLPYIKRLEEGWSDQAPQGMVRLTVLEFEQTIRDALKNVN